MKTLDITDNGKKLCDFVTQKTMLGELSNNDLVQLIEVAGSFLNIKTIPDYAKENNLTYNGVKNHRKIIEIFNTKFVIDND
jgi:hypothetical protein